MHHGHCQSLAHEHAQAPARAFEVASVTPCKPGTPEPPGEHMGMVQFTYPGGRFTAKATTVKYLMEWAYGILPSQHSDGPAWFASERYDIAAKAEGNANDKDMKLMAQALLEDRFKLKVHHETKEVPVIAISLGKSAPKLFPPQEGEKHAIRIEPKMEDQKLVSFHVVATRFTLAQLNETFARQLGRVILDQTGLEGEFNFTLDMSPDERSASPLDPSMVISAMRDQLGLNVKSTKAPVEYYVIDGAEKVVSGN